MLPTFCRETSGWNCSGGCLFRSFPSMASSRGSFGYAQDKNRQVMFRAMEALGFTACLSFRVLDAPADSSLTFLLLLAYLLGVRLRVLCPFDSLVSLTQKTKFLARSESCFRCCLQMSNLTASFLLLARRTPFFVHQTPKVGEREDRMLSVVSKNHSTFLKKCQI